MAKKVGDYFHYGGAIHIHTTESDGTKILEDIAELGQQVDLDFMLFSDHMNLNNRDNGKEGFYGKTLVLVGYEHNDLNDKHHYLLFDSPRVYPENMTAKEFVKAGADDNSIGIMAHPDEIRTKLKEYPSYPWLDWDVEGFTGLELWNQMSEWTEKLTKYNKIKMTFSPRKSIVSPTERILKKWDKLNLTKKFVGIASVDAHAFPIKVGPLKIEIFPYKVHLKTLKTFLILNETLSSDFNTAKTQLYNAIRNCNLYFANVKWGEADDFEFYAFNNSEKAKIGGRLELDSNTKLVVKLPSKATIKIIHNGNKIAQTESDELQLNVTEKGIYRIEAWKGNKGWIFSNHIRISI